MQDNKNNNNNQTGQNTPYCISQEFIETLRETLKKPEHRGAFTRIAEMLGTSVPRVSAAMSGKEYSERVYDAAIEYLEQRKKEVQKKEQKILSITQS